MNTATIVTFVLYLGLMLGIGIWAYLRTRNLSDYMLGGRSLGSGVTAISAGASDMSGWLLLGLPGAIYVSGLNQIWIGVGLAVGAYLNWQYVAGPLRRSSEMAKNAITLPDYFENRLGDGTRILRAVSALVILVFFTLYTSAGLKAGAVLFQGSFGLGYLPALLIGAVVIVSYTFIGGFLAVSWTDFVQGILMFIALILVPTMTFIHLGGWDATLHTAALQSGAADFLNAYYQVGVLGAVSLLAWGLGYFGQPHILARFMAIKSERLIPRARFIGIAWMVAGLYGAIFTGLAAFAYFNTVGNPLDNPETAFITLSQVLFNPWVAGFLLAAILSAIMSTVDSQLLVASSALTEDFYKTFLRKAASQRELVWMGRAAVIGIALVAVLLASDPKSTVLGIVEYAWAGFGAAFGPLVILSLVWRGLTRQGALAGMVGGAATVILWQVLEGATSVELFTLYELVPGFLVCAGLAFGVSRLSGDPAPEVTKAYDRFKASAPV